MIALDLGQMPEHIPAERPVVIDFGFVIVLFGIFDLASFLMNTSLVTISFGAGEQCCRRDSRATILGTGR